MTSNMAIASEPEASTNNKTEGTAAMDTYTRLNLAAITFVHPPNHSDIKHCPCDASTTPQTNQDTTNFIRVYHTEPSVYAYNQNAWLVRETRFSTAEDWHAPGDDLVADDATPGSPVAVTGWWNEDSESDHSIWETRVYYIDTTGHIRERTNRTSLSPTGLKDDFDRSLPEPAGLVPPTPGWKLTPLANDTGEAASASPAIVPFPRITPLQGSKLAAFEVHGKLAEIFYQAPDQSIRVLEYEKGKNKWNDDKKIIDQGKAKPGTPLAALLGGWWEHRLFYVTPEDKLAGAYGDAHSHWQDIEVLPYQLAPSAMISAVAWNYATPFFQIRIYTTDDKDALYEMSYSRHQNGWKPSEESVVPVLGPASKSPAPGGHGSLPLSAVAAILLDGEYRTKVYFHPRRTIGEWDVCARVLAYNRIPKTSTTAAEKRELEEKTRLLIKEDEERKAREEAERKRKEEEEEEARQARLREKEQKTARPKAPTLMLKNPFVIMGDLHKAPEEVDDRYKLVDNLPFPLVFYGRITNKVWITDNGIIAFDDNPAAYTDESCLEYKDAENLPFSKPNFPKYALFPLWADLMICKGGKHGIFYKPDGTTPNRTLSVEWLITQYGATDDYYHFSATFEEARPGVVTYKYNAVDGDAGTKCTVGAQGGDSEHLSFFSLFPLPPLLSLYSLSPYFSSAYSLIT
ncbi:hypothetical protein F5Y19DRAFT_246235 [Xylariaceae sp. FL1651]|nr:hypothetical protein F5Y19DRAFT_246235 [Xylariaceae sp. FL1651]